MKKVSNPNVSLKKIMEEYECDVLNDSEEMYRIKQIIAGLPDMDRTLLILYADSESMKKVSTLLHVSSYTIWSHINRIRETIKIKLNEQ